MKIEEKFNQKLLVEGNDDQHVIWSLCQKFQISENFDVIDCGSIDNLLKQIPVRLKQADIQTVGVIVDADTNIKKRWQSLHNKLESEGYKIDASLNKQGTIITNNDLPKIGIWIMPDNEISGMLEDFIAFLIQSTDQLLPKAENILKEIENENINQYKQIHRSKALIHTWLAWQEDPGTPMGSAITKKYLSTEGILCQNFITWLKTLYETGSA